MRTWLHNLALPWSKVWRWGKAEKLYWWQNWHFPDEFPTWIVEAKKRQGKTRFMCWHAVRDMRHGIRVASNCTIRDRVTGQESERCDSWIDVLRLSVDALRKGEAIKFYIDELHLWLDSRAFKLTPAWFRGWLAQSGHYGAGICGTVQNLRRLEVVARELVDDLLVIKKWYFHLFIFFGPIVPLQWVGYVDQDSVGASDMGDAAAYVFTKARLFFARWWAGYDTRELIQVEEWDPEDKKLLAEVERLCGQAAELVAPGLIAAYSDAAPCRPGDGVASADGGLDCPLPAEGLVAADRA